MIGQVTPWSGGVRPSMAQVVDGARPASLRAAAAADTLACIEPDWMPGEPAPLLALP